MRRVVMAVVAALALAGCGTSPTPPASQPAGPTTSAPSSVPDSSAPPMPATPSTAVASPSESPDEKRLDLAVTLSDGTAEPNGERVDVAVGTRIVVTVTSDREDEVHIHGYDIEIPVTPGRTVTKEFVADTSGSFEIESHEPELLIVQLQVR